MKTRVVLGDRAGPTNRRLLVAHRDGRIARRMNPILGSECPGRLSA